MASDSNSKPGNLEDIPDALLINSKFTLKDYLFPDNSSKNNEQKTQQVNFPPPGTMPHLFSSIIAGVNSPTGLNNIIQNGQLSGSSREPNQSSSSIDKVNNISDSLSSNPPHGGSGFHLSSDVLSQQSQAMMRMDGGLASTAVSDESVGEYGMAAFMKHFRACQKGLENHVHTVGIPVENTGIPRAKDDVMVHRQFAGPFAENAIAAHPHIIKTPKEYQFSSLGKINLPPLNMAKLGDETLIHIFYNFPREAYQNMAAYALIKRGWHYHKVLQGWVKRQPHKPTDPPITNQSECIFLFFNPITWRVENRKCKADMADIERASPVNQSLYNHYLWRHYESKIPDNCRNDTLPPIPKKPNPNP
uniref:NOT2_3_5 domain-containing protein n=1 Tax=Strongyloides papillosus TaxID=174720 RepID=A0A0N5C403_STREA